MITVSGRGSEPVRTSIISNLRLYVSIDQLIEMLGAQYTSSSASGLVLHAPTKLG